MHYPPKLRAELSAGEIRHFGRRDLRDDFGDRSASFADVNLTELRSFSDPLASVVVKFPNGYRLHVTHCAT